MDYTKLPRKLIYKDISSLEELVEKNEDLTLFINNMLSNRYFRSGDAKDRALKCFNTAYYICTLILLSDKHSNWYFRTYCEIACCNDNRNKVYQAFTLSLVYIFLSHTCFEMPDETIIKSLEDELSNPLNFLQEGDPLLNGYYYSDACKDLQKGLGKDWAIIDLFDHRRINIDIYHDMDGSDVIWASKTDYYRRKEIEKIVKALGRDASEKHILVDLIRRDAERFYGFNGAPFVENVKPMLEDLDSCISKEYHEQSDTSEDDITVQPSPTADIIEMKSHISELEKENKQLKEEIEELKKQGSLIGDNQQGVDAPHRYIESLNRQLAEEKNKNAQLEANVKQLRENLELDKIMESDTLRLQIDERIILITTALGTPWNSDLTNQTQLAKIIEHFSGDEWRSIRTRIVAINGEMKKETKNPGEGLSQGTKEAINNVIGWLEKATRGDQNTLSTDKLIKEIKDVFLNTKE